MACPMTYPNCPICAAAPLALGADATHLLGVTSDCRPWPAGSQFLVCPECDHLQKHIDTQWQNDSGSIYKNYEMYAQAHGAEQAVFTGSAEQASAEPRSMRLMRHAAGTGLFPKHGRLLDIGCGNGSFLRAVNQIFPKLILHGLEWDLRHRQAVEAITNDESLTVMDDLDQFKDLDAVSMIHALEHFEDPAGFLDRLKKILAPGGLLIIEVPDWRRNPFDLMIRDHAFHYSMASISRLLTTKGWQILSLRDDWVAKELSVIARAGPGSNAAPEIDPAMDARLKLSQSVRSLQRFLSEVQTKAGGSQFCVFGSSIGAGWLAGHFDDQIRFWLDEDPARSGGEFLGRPIIDPAAAERTVPVVIPLAPEIAAKVAEKLRKLGYHILASFDQAASQL
jgi:SAM-dependent methyltransferase